MMYQIVTIIRSTTGLTVSRTVVSRELMEIGCFESLMISINCPQDCWPGSLENQMAFTLSG